MSYLSSENQKKGQEVLGRTITKSSAIPIDNFVAAQEDGTINAIYLVMDKNKFVRVDRTTKTVTDEQLTKLASEIAKIILGN